MNVTEAIFARRAIRAYSSREVDEATIRMLLRAAVQAPSAMNRQPWLFSIVQTPFS
jgi:nitroreductase